MLIRWIIFQSYHWILQQTSLKCGSYWYHRIDFCYQWINLSFIELFELFQLHWIVFATSLNFTTAPLNQTAAGIELSWLLHCHCYFIELYYRSIEWNCSELLQVADNVNNTYNYPIYWPLYINLPQFSWWICPDPIFRRVGRAHLRNLVRRWD